MLILCYLTKIIDNNGVANTGIYPVLTLISRLNIDQPSSAPEYEDMQPFRPLIESCLYSKIHKLRSMSARCLPAVIHNRYVEDYILSTFDSMFLTSQNRLHGQLMGIKCLVEYYAHRNTQKMQVYRTPIILSTDGDMIVTQMLVTAELLLRDNQNPITRAAFLDIGLALFDYEMTPPSGGIVTNPLCCSPFTNLLEILARNLCLEDIRIRDQPIYPLGWEHYLESAARIVLHDFPALHNESKHDDWTHHVLLDLVASHHEEVALLALTWMEKAGLEYFDHPELKEEILGLLVARDYGSQGWERACAAMIRVLTQYLDAKGSYVDLAECMERRNGKVVAVQDALLSLAGCSIKMV